MRHYIFNGRYGDIIHSLPAVYEYHRRTGERVRFTSAGEFTSVLEGCSYIDAIAAPVPWVNLNDILGYARRMHPEDEFIVMACYGKEYSPGYLCHSYLRDSWRLSQCPQPPETQALVFDRRSPEREQALRVQLGIRKGRPYVLVALEGKSSPFPVGSMVMQDLQLSLSMDVIDLSSVRCERVYDLLGLMEHAAALVTIDTMHLHMAAAVPELPVYALICNGPTRWNRTDWRPQQYWRSTYAEYERLRPQFRAALTSMTQSTPRIHHIWNYSGTMSQDTLRRVAIAHSSWQREAEFAGNWHFHEITSDMLKRVHGDNSLPFVKDLIDLGVSQCDSDTDIVSFSNADVGCIHGITGFILDAIRDKGCAYAHRFDAHEPLSSPPVMESQLNSLHWYPGSDWFWMSAKWWREHRDEMPDMVLGREFWDCVLRQLMKKHDGREVLRAVWHEKHASAWEQPGNREFLPGNVHNRGLANWWFAQGKSDQNDPWRNTWNLVPGVTYKVDPVAVSQLSQRFHPERSPNLIYPRRFEFKPNPVRRVLT